ncbi:hypothetical protein [Enterococcus dispar]|uniref:hypothetical protein n=1 Tax=Enterococcus dispar TaxID=44009 RepID=UPI0021D42468|nr:hypothetical protein [Enterococcus dispar]MCU7356834.1 hypothetical protein [Enterococcus dispar]MDT2704935.1 hypothetical protein [Enterococcus dispar]
MNKTNGEIIEPRNESHSININRDIEIAKYEILKDTKQGLQMAFKEKDSTMVAAIAELLKGY